jgi:hypothetical protein
MRQSIDPEPYRSLLQSPDRLPGSFRSDFLSAEPRIDLHRIAGKYLFEQRRSLVAHGGLSRLPGNGAVIGAVKAHPTRRAHRYIHHCRRLTATGSGNWM